MLSDYHISSLDKCDGQKKQNPWKMRSLWYVRTKKIRNYLLLSRKKKLYLWELLLVASVYIQILYVMGLLLCSSILPFVIKMFSVLFHSQAWFSLTSPLRTTTFLSAFSFRTYWTFLSFYINFYITFLELMLFFSGWKLSS